MNTPSSSNGNWGWRYKPGSLTPDLAAKLRLLTEVSDRTLDTDTRPHNLPPGDFGA
jgi:4-alpha-glucanotransferase